MLPLTWMVDELYSSAPHVLDLSAAARLLTLEEHSHKTDAQRHWAYLSKITWKSLTYVLWLWEIDPVIMM